MYFWLCIFLAVAVISEGAIIFWLLKSRKKPALDRDATALLARLMTGRAVVVTDVVMPGELMMISPRDRE